MTDNLPKMLIIKHCSCSVKRMKNRFLIASTIGIIGIVLIIVGLIISVIFFNALIEFFVGLLLTWIFLIMIIGLLFTK